MNASRGGKKRIARNAGDPRKDVAIPVTECCTRTGHGGRAKNKRALGDDEGLGIQRGAVELGWATVHGSNRFMRTKSCVRNSDP